MNFLKIMKLLLLFSLVSCASMKEAIFRPYVEPLMTLSGGYLTSIRNCIKEENPKILDNGIEFISTIEPHEKGYLIQGYSMSGVVNPQNLELTRKCFDQAQSKMNLDLKLTETEMRAKKVFTKEDATIFQIKGIIGPTLHANIISNDEGLRLNIKMEIKPEEINEKPQDMK